MASSGGGRLSPGRREALTVLAVLLVAAALRLYRLDDLPPGLWYDEAVNGVDALGVLRGERPIFFEGNQGREPLYVYAVALGFGLLGPGPATIRLVSAAFGLATVAATYALAREAFGRRVALLAALVCAVTFWPIGLSRLGFRAVTLPLFEALAALFLFRAVRRDSLACYALSGLAGGLALYTYLASRAVPLWLGAMALAFALPSWRGRTTLRRHATGVVILVAVALLAFAPLARFYLDHPREFLGRVEASSLSARAQTTAADGLETSALKTLGMFVWRGDPNPRHNLPGRPLFDPVLAVAFLLGVAVSLRRIARPEYALLFLWTLAMLAPAVLATEAPHFLRTTGILPAVLLFPALGLEALLVRASGAKKPWLRRLAPTAVALGVALSAVVTARDYFVDWAARSDVYYDFLADVVDAGRLGAERAGQGPILVAGLPYRDRALPLSLYPEASSLSRTFGGADTLVVPAEASGDVYYVYPRAATRDADDFLCRLLPCDRPDRVALDPAGGEAARMYRASAEALRGIEPTRPLGARLGDHLEVVGYDLPRAIEPGRSVTLAIHGRILRPVVEPGHWKLFAHLVGPDGRNRSSAYAQAFDSTWRPDDAVVFWLDLPTFPDFEAGLYQVHFGLFETGSQARKRIVDGAGRDAGDVLALGPARVRPSDAASAPVGEVPSLARFGESIRLLGYEVQPNATDEGTLAVTLRWAAERALDSNYTVFVHLVDGSGRLVTQHDSQPAGGRLPTGLWLPKEVVVDEHVLPLPPEARGQTLGIVVGLYRLETGQRLPLTEPTDGPPADHLRITEVDVR